MAMMKFVPDFVFDKSLGLMMVSDADWHYDRFCGEGFPGLNVF